jgi:hypothetical protein
VNLRTVHQVLIVAAGSLAAVFALRSCVMFARGGGVTNVLLGLASALVGVAAFLYFRRFRRKLAAPVPRVAAK